MPIIVKSPLRYIERGDSVDEITNEEVLDSIKDNIDKTFDAINAFESYEESIVTFEPSPSGILKAYAIVDPDVNLTLDGRFDSIINVQVTVEGNAHSVGYEIVSADEISFDTSGSVDFVSVMVVGIAAE